LATSTGYELLYQAARNSQTQPVDAARMRGTAAASLPVYRKMMSVLTSADPGRASQNATVR
jgi:hypothetical protein